MIWMRCEFKWQNFNQYYFFVSILQSQFFKWHWILTYFMERWKTQLIKIQIKMRFKFSRCRTHSASLDKNESGAQVEWNLPTENLHKANEKHILRCTFVSHRTNNAKDIQSKMTLKLVKVCGGWWGCNTRHKTRNNKRRNQLNMDGM